MGISQDPGRAISFLAPALNLFPRDLLTFLGLGERRPQIIQTLGDPGVVPVALRCGLHESWGRGRASVVRQRDQWFKQAQRDSRRSLRVSEVAFDQPDADVIRLRYPV